jgi:hypothetical protein
VALPYDIRESRGFKISWDKLSYKAGRNASDFDESVLAAVRRLWAEGPGTGERRGDAKYAVPVTPEYELVYEWVTERDRHGNATFNHLDLLPLERTK